MGTDSTKEELSDLKSAAEKLRDSIQSFKLRIDKGFGKQVTGKKPAPAPEPPMPPADKAVRQMASLFSEDQRLSMEHQIRTLRMLG